MFKNDHEHNNFLIPDSISMLNRYDVDAMKIHGVLTIESDTDSGKSEFDDEYYKNLPPATPINESKIVVIKSDSKLNCSPKKLKKHQNNLNNDQNMSTIPNQRYRNVKTKQLTILKRKLQK